MTTKHTPGPWIVEEDNDTHGTYGINQTEPGGIYVAETIAVSNEGEELANANLLAAAPELLAMVIKLSDYILLNPSYDTKKTRELINEVIELRHKIEG